MSLTTSPLASMTALDGKTSMQRWRLQYIDWLLLKVTKSFHRTRTSARLASPASRGRSVNASRLCHCFA